MGSIYLANDELGEQSWEVLISVGAVLATTWRPLVLGGDWNCHPQHFLDNASNWLEAVQGQVVTSDKDHLLADRQ